MSSRKDILKNLGIPEYPWSSDDDETNDSRPLSTSGSRSNGQQQASTSSGISGSVSTSEQAIDLIYSLLNHTTHRSGVASHTPDTSGSSRNDDPLAYMSRTPHTPAAELCDMAKPGRDTNINRVLAFKRITKNLSKGRHSRNTSRGTYRHGPEIAPCSDGSIRLPYNTRGPSRSMININIPVSVQQSGGNEQQPRSTSERRFRSPTVEVQNSEDSETVLSTTRCIPPMQASASSAPAPSPAPASAPERSDNPISVEEDNGIEAQVSSNNTSGSGVALEEEIVEIVDEPTLVDMVDQACASCFMTDSDPNLASTSRAEEVDAPEPEQHDHGVKRKRRVSVDDLLPPPFTVKEFNQSLLRLLECPVCLEWMEPPMSQCRRGHLVCSRCRSRLASCPVCRTTFSSVRNRAMEGVAEMLRYPCRHGCGREVRLRRRTPHEASCSSRKYQCPAPLCLDRQPLPRSQLAHHFHSKHMHIVKIGTLHQFGIKVNSEAHDNWFILALNEFFHLKVDVDIRTWGVIVYVSYIGPKCNAMDYAYEVTIDGQHHSRKMQYRRATHSDLESPSLNVSRQDCFHLTLDQALNFIRFKNRHCDTEKYLEFTVMISKIDPPPSRDDSDT